MSSRGTRKSQLRYTANKRRKGFMAVALPWLRRFGIICAVIGVTVWGGFWFFASDADTKTYQWAEQKIIHTAASAGFRINDVTIEGRHFSDARVIKASIGIEKGAPLFAFDPFAVKAGLEALPWIETAQVQRSWPDRVLIRLKERTPMALWKDGDHLELLDDNGAVIKAANLAPFKTLIIVTGDNAPQNSAAFLKTLTSNPDLFKRVDTAFYIENRRWDIRLNNGLQIKLPENDLGIALEVLGKEQADNQILDRDYRSIDLRNPGAMTIRMPPGAANHYKANFQSSMSESNSI
ncbi:MAG: cell division protein FtsQ/DivIB [Bdellovibrionales bacterium]